MEPRFYSNLSPRQGWSWETPPERLPESEIAEVIEADVVIVGGGISGLAAGARCAEKGLATVIIDKNDTMQAHAGQIGVLDSPLMRELGVSIDKKQFARDWMEICGSRVNEELLWLYINRSGEAFEWMTGIAGDCLNIQLYAGCYKGPGFNEYPGTHHVFLKPGSTKYKNRGGGMLVCEILEKEFLDKGGRLFRSVRASQLEKNADGRVTAAVAAGADGAHRRYVGKKAVILATGDIGGNKEMLEAFCPIGLKPSKNIFWPVGSNCGDGHKMAYWAGAAFDDPAWAPSLHNLAYCSYTLFFLHVNRRGKRFMNEDTWMQAKAVRCLMQPGGDYAWTVMDSKWLEEFGERFDMIGGQGNMPLRLSGFGAKWDPDCGMKDSIDDSIANGNGVVADTLDELAGKMGVPAEALKSTVARYNEVFKLGDDVDFGKRPELLTSIVKPPFYALKWGPALLDVFGGAITNTHINVLAPDLKPIPGLYAVGNCAGGFYGVDYPLLMNGNSYGRALTWALAVADGIIADN